tara:strand:- start:1120 stop:1563 length:444 start_codon:yes stop_codon:yes gene_type:complete
MRLSDVYSELTLAEIIVLGVIAFIFLFLLPASDEKVIEEPIVTEGTFDEYPLIAWKDTDKKGDIVRIKYRVFKDKTFIQVFNEDGMIVHDQPFQRNPWEDGTPRDFTYNWTLYYTQDYGDEIPPGDYEIRVCHLYPRNVDLVTWITI